MAAGRKDICRDIGSKKVHVVGSFCISDKPAVDVQIIYAAGSRFSVVCFSLRRGEADRLFYGIDIFLGKIKVISIQFGQ